MSVNGLDLKEPTQVDWDKVGGSNFLPPPPAKDANGKSIVYFGQLPLEIKSDEVDNEGYRTYLLDPIKLVKNGADKGDGYVIRFTRVGLRPFKNGANAAAILLKAAGVTAKPQKTAEYDAAIKLTKNKVVPFTIDWVAKNKDTGEAIFGYENFPEDPERPGQRKCILKQGDTYKDKEGNTQVVQAEVLFANAQVRFFETKKS